MKKNAFFGELKSLKLTSFITLLISGTINAIGVTLFLSPVNLYDSGLSGTSLYLARVFSPLTLSFFLIVLNIPFFIIGLKRQGINFTIYSIFAIFVYSMMSYLIQHVLPIENIATASPVAGTDLLLCALFGGLISGVGSGLTIRGGGAIDGIEVMAVIFAKKIGLTVGVFVMIYNAFLYVIAAITFSSWVIPLYSLIAYALGIKSVDFVIEGLDKAKAAHIITSKPEEMAGELSEKLGRGVTLINTKGYYSNEENIMIYCVVNRFEIGKLKSIITKHDRKAFVTITDISDTLGSSLKFSFKRKKPAYHGHGKKVEKAVQAKKKKVDGREPPKTPPQEMTVNIAENTKQVSKKTKAPKSTKKSKK